MPGAAAGAVAGVSAGVAVARPSLFGNILSLPFKAINAPFYYWLGGHDNDQRVRGLEAALREAGEAQNEWLRVLADKALSFDGIQIKLSQDYLDAIKRHLASAGGPSPEAVDLALKVNPLPPSLCSIGGLSAADRAQG